MLSLDDTQTFEDARSRLLGLAYRILGSVADAEDAVQDTFVKWTQADRRHIEAPAAWLTTACTRRCLDLLRAGQRVRVSYVGAWLPEPIHTPVDSEMEARMDLASSLTTAFLLVLERLTPKERAAYLLHDVFEVPYPEVAETLGLTESACRKLVSRAKLSIDRAKVRHRTPPERQERLLQAFRAAIDSGSTGELAILLSDDIRLSVDGGGKVPAVLDVLTGKDEVLTFLAERLHDYWADYEWLTGRLNGTRGFVHRQRGETVSVVSFAYDEHGRATDIYIVRNPEKLARVDTTAIH